MIQMLLEQHWNPVLCRGKHWFRQSSQHDNCLKGVRRHREESQTPPAWLMSTTNQRLSENELLSGIRCVGRGAIWAIKQVILITITIVIDLWHSRNLCWMEATVKTKSEVNELWHISWSVSPLTSRCFTDDRSVTWWSFLLHVKFWLVEFSN